MTDSLSQVAGHLTKRPIARQTIVAATAVAEWVVMALCLWFATFALSTPEQFAPITTALLAMCCALPVVCFNVLTGAYLPQAQTRLKRTLAQGCISVSMLAFFGIVSGLAGPPLETSFFYSILICGVPLLSLRLISRAFLSWAISFGALERRAIIAGGGEPAERLIRALAARPDNDIRVVAIFDDRDDERAPPQTLGVPNIGGFKDVLRFVHAAEFDLVLITLPLEAEERIQWLLSIFKSLPHEIHLVEFSKDYAFENAHNVGLILARDSSFDAVRRWQKRGFDLLFGSMALLLTAPFMVLAALAIRLETPGPVFFTQWRHGFANRSIPVLKFRSMYHDQQDRTGTNVVQRGGDPRVTRVGALLRKTSIDELPQLLCVLRGDLSLVGPRPHALDARSTREEPFSNLVEDYASRHRLPPGVTGWAQVNGLRGGIEDREQLRKRVAHDLHYIENWSIWFDLRILLRTPLALLNTRNAY